MNAFDNYLYHAINGLSGKSVILDHIMAFFAQDALELYAILFVIAWFTLPRRDEMRRHQLILAGFAGILGLIINVLIAHVWYRARPFVVLPKGTFNQVIPHPVDSSFPSDHTTGSMAFAAGVAGNSQKWVSISFTALAIIVMFSRVYCGVHWPTDVLASIVVGILASLLVRRFSRFLFPITALGLKVFGYGSRNNRNTKRHY
jgi:undecaprenyl-diphosphatase